MENEKELQEEKVLEKALEEAPHAAMVDSSPYLGEATHETSDSGEQRSWMKPKKSTKSLTIHFFQKRISLI